MEIVEGEFEPTPRTNDETTKNRLEEVMAHEEVALAPKRITKWNLFTAKWFQIIFGVPAYFIFKFFIHLRAVGVENLILSTEYEKTGVIFASNHVGELDALVVRSAMPFFAKTAPLFFVARASGYYKEMHSIRKYLYGGGIFRFGGAYPAYTGTKSYGKSLSHHIELLNKGQSVMIFPEGKMSPSGELGQARGGTGFLCHELRLPVIPVGIDGTFKMGVRNFLLRRRTVLVAFGKPLYPDEIFTKGELDRALSTEEYRKISWFLLSKTREALRKSNVLK